MPYPDQRRLFQGTFRRIVWHGNHATLVFAGGTKAYLLMVDGEFLVDELLTAIPEGMELKTPRMDPAMECVAVGCNRKRYSKALCRLHYARTKATGKPRAKLTEEQVQELRALKKANPKQTTRELGKRFGISHNAVSRLLRGVTWKR